MGWSADGGENFLACLLAGPAGLGTDTAMIHAVLGVSRALVATEPARGRACLEGGPNQLRFERCLPRHNAAGRVAQIGAVEIEPDATGERSLVLLTEAGIGPARARLLAVEASLDTGGTASALPPSA